MLHSTKRAARSAGGPFSSFWALGDRLPLPMGFFRTSKEPSQGHDKTFCSGGIPLSRKKARICCYAEAQSGDTLR